MTQTDAKPAAKAAVAERPSLLGQNSAPVAVAMLVVLPVAIWGLAVLAALVADGGRG